MDMVSHYPLFPKCTETVHSGRWHQSDITRLHSHKPPAHRLYSLFSDDPNTVLYRNSISSGSLAYCVSPFHLREWNWNSSSVFLLWPWHFHTLYVECSSLEFVWFFLMTYAFLAQTSQKWPGVISVFHVWRSRMLKCPISDDVGFLVKSVSARLLFCKVN